MQTTPAEASALIAQLSRIDVTLVNDLFRETMASTSSGSSGVAADTSIEPCQTVTRLAGADAGKVDAWRAAGLAAIAQGRVGGLILAGGQGTRLGFDRPKGEYDVGLPSHKTLFQLQAERVTRLKETAAKEAGRDPKDVSLPVYVMTSPMTDADTRSTWSAHSNYGLPASDVFFFCQGTLPCLTFDGKIMLETAGAVAEAPDGNGGIYRALHLSGALADMQRRGLAGVHVFAVDNAVVKAADPVFFGFCLESDADVGSKSCPKAGPHEKVGVLCRRQGAYTVVEYSEMDKASAELRDPSTGELVFNTGNICIHYFSTAFLAGPCSPASLPKVYHVARKSIPYAHPETGLTLSKAEMAGKGNTGIKLESFIFDVFPAAQRMAVLEIRREEEFSPVKNAPGSAEDSPDTARSIISTLHRSWLARAGASVEGEGLVEVSPLVSYAGEGLGMLAGQTLRAPLLVKRASEPLPAGVAAAESGSGSGAGVSVVGDATSALRVYIVA